MTSLGSTIADNHPDYIWMQETMAIDSKNPAFPVLFLSASLTHPQTLWNIAAVYSYGYMSEEIDHNMCVIVNSSKEFTLIVKKLCVAASIELSQEWGINLIYSCPDDLTESDNQILYFSFKYGSSNGIGSPKFTTIQDITKDSGFFSLLTKIYSISVY